MLSVVMIIIGMVGIEEGGNNGIQQPSFGNWNVFVSRNGNPRNVLIFVVIVGHVAVVVLPLVECGRLRCDGFQGLRRHVGESGEGRGRWKRKTLTMPLRNWRQERC